MTNASSIIDFRVFLGKYPTKEFKKGEIIIFQGEVPRSGYVVKTGIVKAYNLSVGGDEKPVAFYSADAVFPGPWTYNKVPNAIYYYEAFTPSVTLTAINKDDFVHYIKSKPDLLYMELERYLMDQLGTSMRLNALQHSRASDKLLYTLHYLALNHGKTVGPQKIEILLDLTHQDFANLTGLTRETAATELNKLKRKGVINYGKQMPYRLDVARLMNLLNDQYIADMQIRLQ
jgi:CRP-like cAMP-binding protein